MPKVATGSAAGYSGTPLAKKLGIKPGTRLVPLEAPAEYLGWLAPLPDGVEISSWSSAKSCADQDEPIVAKADERPVTTRRSPGSQ
jgi:hypothetical protein